MYVCMYVWMDGWMDVCMYVCMYAYVSKYIYIYALYLFYVCIQNKEINIYIYMQSAQGFSSKCAARHARHLPKCSGAAKRHRSYFSKTNGVVASAESSLPVRVKGAY